SIPVELETIVLKAVAKNPAERYATAQELSADLRRYLDDKPILARRPGPIDRARKWARRHPAFVNSAIVVLILGGTVLLVSQWLISIRAQEAERRFRQARKGVDLLVQVADEEFGDDPGSQAARRRLLERALPYYQEFIEQAKDRADVHAELEA